MSELTKMTKDKTSGVAGEVAALQTLIATLNNPGDGADHDFVSDVPQQSPQATRLGVSGTPPQPEQPAPVVVPPAGRIFFTGRIKAGKDYLAAAAGYTIIGFADPIYWLVNRFFGTDVSSTSGKEIPGVRDLLQKIGQWGRGTVNAQYPLTSERALFSEYVRSLTKTGVDATGVRWELFGIDTNLWLDAAMNRAARLDTNRIAITNVRFENEFTRLKNEGWQHWHVLCSAPTWKARLAKDGVPENTTRDISEQLAGQLDNSVTTKISRDRLGAKLKCVWNDPIVPSPSARLHSTADFLSAVNK